MYAFFPLGLVIVSLDTVADMYYFWVNNFRPKEELKQIIIPKENSTISHKSLRDLHITHIKYTDHKVKTVGASTLVRNFTRSLTVMKNIQFLIFGQFISRSQGGNDLNKGYTLKTMKTQDLEDARKEELLKLDDSI